MFGLATTSKDYLGLLMKAFAQGLFGIAQQQLQRTHDRNLAIQIIWDCLGLHGIAYESWQYNL